ncbi:hypothetical protein HerbRD11066_75070 [Herbidospora sp. RD11066]
MSGPGEVTVTGGPDDAADLRALARLLHARDFSTVFIPDMCETAAARAGTPGLLVLTGDRREAARVYMGPRSGAYMLQLLGPGSDASRVVPVMDARHAAARIAAASGVSALLAGASLERGAGDVAE